MYSSGAGDFITPAQMTNRSSNAPLSYNRDEFTEDFESKTEHTDHTESDIEDDITEGQLPDSGSDSEFNPQSNTLNALKHQDLTEDFSIRSEDISKYADFMADV